MAGPGPASGDGHGTAAMTGRCADTVTGRAKAGMMSRPRHFAQGETQPSAAPTPDEGVPRSITDAGNYGLAALSAWHGTQDE